MEAIQNLAPTDPRAREALLGILGTTLAGLKEIDRSIVGSSNNVKAHKTDINKFAALLSPTAVHQPQHFTPPPQFTPQPAPVQHITSSPQIQEEDPNQLVFDFNKPITPETINNKLDIIIEKLNTIINKIDS